MIMAVKSNAVEESKYDDNDIVQYGNVVCRRIGKLSEIGSKFSTPNIKYKNLSVYKTV